MTKLKDPNPLADAFYRGVGSGPVPVTNGPPTDTDPLSVAFYRGAGIQIQPKNTPSVPSREDPGVFRQLLKGTKAGWQGANKAVGDILAFAGELTEAPEIADLGRVTSEYWGQKVEANAPRVQNFTDINWSKPADFLDWAAWNVGQMGAQLAVTAPFMVMGGPAATAGGTGGFTALKGLLTRGNVKQFGQFLKGWAKFKPMDIPIGILEGGQVAAGQLAALQAGEIEELDPVRGLAAAFVAAKLEELGAENAVNRLLTTGVAGAKGKLLMRIGKQALATGVGEGTEEFFQQYAEQMGIDPARMGTYEQFLEAVNGAAAGFIGGLGIGGPTGAVSKSSSTDQDTPIAPTGTFKGGDTVRRAFGLKPRSGTAKADAPLAPGPTNVRDIATDEPRQNAAARREAEEEQAQAAEQDAFNAILTELNEQNQARVEEARHAEIRRKEAEDARMAAEAEARTQAALDEAAREQTEILSTLAGDDPAKVKIVSDVMGLSDRVVMSQVKKAFGWDVQPAGQDRYEILTDAGTQPVTLALLRRKLAEKAVADADAKRAKRQADEAAIQKRYEEEQRKKEAKTRAFALQQARQWLGVQRMTDGQLALLQDARAAGELTPEEIGKLEAEEGKGSRIEEKGSRIEEKGSRIEGKGSRIEGKGSKKEESDILEEEINPDYTARPEREETAPDRQFLYDLMDEHLAAVGTGGLMENDENALVGKSAGGWISRTVKAFGAKHRTPLRDEGGAPKVRHLSYDELRTILAKARKGEELTPDQETILDEMVEQAEDERAYIDDINEAARYEEEGFTPTPDGQVATDELLEGDELVIAGEIFRVTDIDEDGNVKMKDGTIRKVRAGAVIEGVDYIRQNEEAAEFDFGPEPETKNQPPEKAVKGAKEKETTKDTSGGKIVESEGDEGGTLTVPAAKEPTAKPVPHALATLGVPGPKNTVYHKNYNRLAKLFKKWNLGRPEDLRRHAKLTDPDKAFMDLSIEYLRTDEDGQPILAMAHYYEQNGDLVPDPDMEIRILPDGMIEALTYQDYRSYQAVYPEPGKINQQLKKSLNSFLGTWLKNIEQQGQMPESETKKEKAEDVTWTKAKIVPTRTGVVAVPEQSAEDKQAKEDPYTAAVGVMSGGVAARIEQSPYEFAYGETEKGSDIYYEMAGMFTGGKADRLVDAGITIRKKPSAFGTENKIFTEDKAAKAREILKAKLGGKTTQLNMGLDPEIISAGIDLAGYYIEGGARTFAAYSARMVADIGEAIRPYLKSFYLAVRNYPGFDNTGMETEAELDRAPPPPDLINPPAGELFETPVKEPPGPDIDAFIATMTKAVYRSAHRSRNAIYRGKRSRATVNVDKLAEQFGIDRQIVDQIAGYAIMGTLESNSEHDIYKNIAALTKHYLPEQKKQDTSSGIATEAAPLEAYGLSVTKDKTNTGKTVWNVSGPQTKTWKETIKKAGGRWYGPKKVWSFYNGDPTADLLGKLPPIDLVHPSIRQAESPTTEPAAAPYEAVAAQVESQLNRKEAITWQQLFGWADEAFAGTQAAGAYTPKDAYDALEMGVNRYLAGQLVIDPTMADVKFAQGNVEALHALLDLLPTQSKRTGEMDEFQQFSTPPPLAYVANWAANLQPDDVYLEPSAGTGDLAIFAKYAGVKEVIVNELAPRRLAILRALGFDRVFAENGEQLNNILPADVQPTVIVMNPPFSSTAGRIPGSRHTDEGLKHVEQALKRLAPGGRLVLIIGEGISAPSRRAWWDKIEQSYSVRVNLGLSGKHYAKYGTTFDNRLIIIDKTGKTSHIIVTGRADHLKDVLPLIEEVRNDRQELEKPGRQGEPASGEPKGQEPPAEPRPGLPLLSAAGPGATGSGSRPGSGPAGPGTTGRTPVSMEAVGRRPVPEPGRDQDQQPAEKAGPEHSGPARQPHVGHDQGLPEGESLTLTSATGHLAEEAATGSVYEPYRPEKITVAGAKEHPGRLDQSASLAGTPPPSAAYVPRIHKDIIATGKLSDAQLEAIIYAGQSHQEVLESGERKGYFIGDGTGVGKGREIAGILWDNWNQGRKKAVWISEKQTLIQDAGRDLEGVGWNAKHLFSQNKIKAADPIPASEGILFTTYDTLKSKEKKMENGVDVGKTRLEQITDWLGETFDGVIVFDEAHNMGNAIGQATARGSVGPSQKALAGLGLQQALPDARVVYVSATGATEISNLAYAQRLGLWGPGTAFGNQNSFINAIAESGLAGMELVAMNMKAMGVYMARNLSYADVTYDRLEHPLTDKQREIYDDLARGWQLVLHNIHEALGVADANARTRSNAMSKFWGAHQRFFNQIITSMQMPSVITAVQKDLAEGRSAVLQLVNTNEASQERALAHLEEGDTLDDLDLTPRDHLMNYIEHAFPVQQHETYMDENHNVQSRPVIDSQGRPVVNAEAVAMRDALLDRLGAIAVPDGPLEMILNHLGAEQVAEVTGRKRRIVVGKDGRKIEEKRSRAICAHDTDAFMSGKKRILVFSDAGGTGRSYHADNTADNQQRRVHYLLQLGGRADKAIQGFGRTHRTNQASAPHYVLVTTDLKGQYRFICSIARRLDQLGALTKGQRQTGSQGIFQARDNLESTYAQEALRRFYEDLVHGRIADMSLAQFENETGLRLTDKDGHLVEHLPPIRQFLNRILSMTYAEQNKTFDRFSERLDAVIAAHERAGTLDVGLETLRAARVEKVSEQVVYTDSQSGAETRYVELAVSNPTPRLTWEDAQNRSDAYAVNKRSGQIWNVGRARSHTKASGEIIRVRELMSPAGHAQSVEEEILADPEKWTALQPAEAEALWQTQYDTVPEMTTRNRHLITGALLPIWDRINIGHIRLLRVNTADGEKMVGRLINEEDLNRILTNLGATGSQVTLAPAEIADKILDEHYRITLANEWALARRVVSGDERIELIGPDYENMDEMARLGIFTERISWKTRYFIPTDARAAGIIASLIRHRPIVNMTREGSSAGPSTPQYAVEPPPVRRRQGIPAAAARSVIASHYKNDKVKAHPDYKAAKKGDRAAAVRLVPDVVKAETVEEARKRFGAAPIYCAVHAEEEAGRNAIPRTLAAYYAALTGGTTDTEIVQAIRSHHTGAKAMERLIAPAKFNGAVVKGGRYVLVDDVTTMGGTLAELANHILQNGGDVIGVITLTNASRNSTLLPKKETIRSIERRLGDEVKRLFGVEPGALTQAEALYINGFRDAESLRNRAAKARRERTERLRAKGILPSETEDVTPPQYTAGLHAKPLDKKSLDALVEDLQKTVKGITIRRDPNGNPWIETKNERYCRVQAVYHIVPDKVGLEIGYGTGHALDNISGSYQSFDIEALGTRWSEIKLVRGQAGFWTLTHEFMHFLEDIGAISNTDKAVLNRKIQALIARDPEAYQHLANRSQAEARAEWVGRTLAGVYDATTPTGKILQKIKGIIDRIVNALGLRTSGGVMRDIREGRVFEQDTPQHQDDTEAYQAAAYHGSPHTFDKFSTGKIGSGEGAQAYGYGLYFAGKKEVAEYYKKNLEKTTRAHNTFDGKKLSYDLLRKMEDSTDPVERQMAYTYGIHPTSTKDIRPKIQERIDDLEKQLIPLRDRLAKRRNPEPGTIYSWSVQDYEDRISGLEMQKSFLEEAKRRSNFIPEQKGGRLYEVELAPEEDEYLLWDKPLSEQSGKVKGALRDAFDSESGETRKALKHSWDSADSAELLYRDLSQHFQSELRNSPSYRGPAVIAGGKAASDYLHSLGIRGIKYLDAISRNKTGVLDYREELPEGWDYVEQKEGWGIKDDKGLWQAPPQYGSRELAHSFVFGKKPNYNYVIFSDEDVTITAQYQLARTAEDLLGKKVAPTVKRTIGQGVATLTGRMTPQQKAITGQLVKHWREFWRPFSTIPDGDQVLSRRYRAMGDVARAVRFIEGIYQQLAVYPDETKKDLFWYLNGDIPLENLPEDAQKLAEMLRRRTEIIGEMLVDRGIIDEGQFEKYRGKYIHYMYAKHVLGEDKPVFLTSTGKLNLTYTKSRNPNLTLQQRKELGLIEDASVAVPVGMGKALTDIAKFDYLASIADNPDWVWQPSIVKVPMGKQLATPIRGRTRRYVKMGVGKLVEQKKLYDEMMRAHPSPQVAEIHKILTETLAKAEEESQNIPADFVQLPNAKSYGPLAGAYIKKPIADDIKPVMDVATDRGKLMSSLLDIEREGMAIFKMGKVALNLPTATRNVISNIIQNNMRGRPLAKIPGDIVKACESIKAKDAYYEEAFAMGLFHTNWFVSEINNVLDEFRKVEAGRLDQLLMAVKNVAKYYGKIDDINKLAIFIERRKAGKSVDEAVLEAMKWGMDYSLTSRSIKGLRQTIMPFVTYQYKIAPLIAESLKARPWVLAKYALIYPIAKSLAMMFNDLDDDDWEDLEKQLPAYVKKSGSMMILPYKTDKGQWQWVNLEYFFPWGNYLNIFRDIRAADLGETVRDAGISNPFLSMFYTGLSAREDQPPLHAYFGTPVYNDLDPAPVKAAKFLEYMANTWMPSMLTRKGALGYTGKMLAGGEDRWGRTVTPAQAIGRWFGVNILAVSPDQTRAQTAVRIQDLKKELSRIENNPAYDAEAKAAYRQRMNERLAKLAAESPAAILPITKAKGVDPVYEALKEMAARGSLRTGPPSRSVTANGLPMKMTADQYREYLDKSSDLARVRLKPLVESPAWDKMTEEQKAETVSKIMAHVRKGVRHGIKVRMTQEQKTASAGR